MMNDIHVNRWGSVCSIISLAYFTARFLISLLEPPQNLTSLSGLPRLQAVLFLGLAAAAAHGVLWTLAEKTFGWHFGAGGGTSLPQGWSAVVLSLTMTVPLVSLPPLYARLTHTQIVLPGHSLAACFVVVFAAVGHVFLYGAKKINFPGMRNIIFPLGSLPDWRRALQMESVYAATHFVSIVLIYHILIASRVAPLSITVVYSALISAGVWLSGVCVFIFLKYPESLADKRWIEVRGVVHALMLTVALQGGMLM